MCLEQWFHIEYRIQFLVSLCSNHSVQFRVKKPLGSLFNLFLGVFLRLALAELPECYCCRILAHLQPNYTNVYVRQEQICLTIDKIAALNACHDDFRRPFCH